ncbi:MAG: VCBS repeat-containing protein [Planctomycetes bacterium]|nr:VCBS repeat-containing protein [Planctomycetota bacterium]
MTARIRPYFNCSAVLLCATSVFAQTTLREWQGAANGDALGAGIANVGDFDGDGIDDFALGIPGDDTLGPNRGAVSVVSGADGHEIQRYFGGLTETGFGSSVMRLGDVDLDGTVDLVVGSLPMGPNELNVPTRFSVLSGTNGSLLWSHSLATLGNGRGVAVVVLGDVNVDGRLDIGIGNPNEGATGASGRVRVFSGIDGVQLHNVVGAGDYVGNVYGLAPAGDLDGDGRADWWMSYGSLFQASHAQARSGFDGHVLFDLTLPLEYYEYTGVRFVGGNDLDGDGVPDLVVGSHGSPGKGGYGPGHVYAYSGATHAILWSRVGADQYERIGLYVYDVGDIDGDGVRDVATSVGFNYPGQINSARFFSGATGADIGVTVPFAPGSALLNLCAAGDVDGDGHGDWIGARFTTGFFGQLTFGSGVVQVQTFAREALRADRFALNHATGGVQLLSLDFGAPFAGRNYLVLGSLTGTTPGIATSAGLIPLTVDPYFWSTRRAVGSGHLTGASGVLDAHGRATASFNLAPDSQRFPVGTILRHAAVVLDASGTSPAAVSRAVPLLVKLGG